MAPPVNAPEAVNCFVAPSTMVALAGETEIDVTGADVSVVVPVMALNVAAIVVDPVVDATELASPLLLIVAIPVSEEFHVASDVRSCVAPFWSAPRAEN